MDQKINVMKFKRVTWVAGGIILLQSCTIFSLHPLYHEEDLLMESSIEGMWTEVDEGDAFVYLEKMDDKMYLFRYMEEQDEKYDIVELDTVSFEAGLLKVGEHYFLDLYPYYDKEDEGWYLFRNFVPTHSFLKIEWENDRMALYLFDYDRMKKLFEQNRIRIKHEMLDDFIVITASTEELQRFIRKYADDDEAFEDPEKFIKTK